MHLSFNPPFKKHAPEQSGINMVDLMMWLVIASLLLATAIQSIGYYQQAAYASNAKSDVASEHTWVHARSSIDGKTPGTDEMVDALSKGELKLSNNNAAVMSKHGEKYCIGVRSFGVNAPNIFYSSSDDPSNVVRGDSVPDSCGTYVELTPGGTVSPSASPSPTGSDTATPTSTPTPTAPVVAAPTTAPVVTGAVASSTTLKFTWGAVDTATSYVIEKQVNGGSWVPVAEGSDPTSTTITANPGDSVSVRVTPANSGGTGPTSASSATVSLPAAASMAIWGNNNNYTLGSSTIPATFQSPNPMAFPASIIDGKTITDIATGNAHACVIASGAAYCWGMNGSGQVGNGNNTNQLNPVAVNATGDIKGLTLSKIDAGGDNTCALSSDGKAYCWGNTSFKMLGKYWTVGSSPVAVDMTGVLAGKTFTDISVGDYNVCGIAGGAAYCWGTNSDGELGNGSTTDSYTAVPVSGLAGKTVTSISVGRWGSCAVANGAAYCWGKNEAGELGDGSTISTTAKSLVPVAVNASGVLTGKVVTSVDRGWFHTCALAEGKAYCWGANTNGGGAVNGQLGNNGTTNSGVPVAVDTSGVLSGKTIDKVFAGALTSCVLSGGQPYCWGAGTNGVVGDGTRLAAVKSPVAVTTSGVLSGKSLKKLVLAVYHTLAY